MDINYNMCKKGKFTFFYGTMSSGKSLHLLATAFNFQKNNIPFIVFKSEIDDRDGEGVIHSRALGDRECVSIKSSDNLFKIVASYMSQQSVVEFDNPLKWVLVDEAQFLTPEQVEQLAAIADNLGVSVLCYGLRTDFKTQLFPGSKRLFELADTLEEIKSTCKCNNKTIFNARVNANGEVVTNGAQVEVGGDDRYVSMCRNCYFTKTKHPLYCGQDESEE